MKLSRNQGITESSVIHGNVRSIADKTRINPCIVEIDHGNSVLPTVGECNGQDVSRHGSGNYGKFRKLRKKHC